MNKKFISWRRVSTAKQRGSHLGLEAQKSIIDFFIEREKGELIADYEECHSGTDLAGCTELKKAKAHCKRIGATLIIAKTDRCRDTIEALQLYEEMNGKIYFCDLPHTDKFTLTLFFSLAEREAMIVSLRTKQALAAKKARGEALGGAASKWRNSYYSMPKEERKEINMRKGEMKNLRHLQSRDVVTFLKVLKRTFPNACTDDDAAKWDWSQINTKGDNKRTIAMYMNDYKEMDESGSLFVKWDFSADATKLQQKLGAFIQHTRESLTYKQRAAELEAKFVNN